MSSAELISGRLRCRPLPRLINGRRGPRARPTTKVNPHHELHPSTPGLCGVHAAEDPLRQGGSMSQLH